MTTRLDPSGHHHIAQGHHRLTKLPKSGDNCRDLSMRHENRPKRLGKEAEWSGVWVAQVEQGGGMEEECEPPPGTTFHILLTSVSHCATADPVFFSAWSQFVSSSCCIIL
jgi:hypothetical protein